MVFRHLMTGIEVADCEFDNTLYPKLINNLSATHFTPIDIAIKAAQYLVDVPGVKVLDIGSGAGKFCMIGAARTEGHFTGIEQRLGLHQLAKQISKKCSLTNIEFIHANITAVDFSQYQAFYFYNSFFENIAPIDKIDNTIVLKRELYQTYTTYVKCQLKSMPIGTRLVTYFSSYDEVPESYKMVSRIKLEKLTLWEKKHD
ncbi:MAG: cyclopropane fatty-acyl-phospholipid synthase-like methyltransferase [Paraglaciecola sp.]|jgi:cyclopropane fatty-acyl-phospholipid synthase-like methyltransferase